MCMGLNSFISMCSVRELWWMVCKQPILCVYTAQHWQKQSWMIPVYCKDEYSCFVLVCSHHLSVFYLILSSDRAREFHSVLEGHNYIELL